MYKTNALSTHSTISLAPQLQGFSSAILRSGCHCDGTSLGSLKTWTLQNVVHGYERPQKKSRFYFLGPHKVETRITLREKMSVTGKRNLGAEELKGNRDPQGIPKSLGGKCQIHSSWDRTQVQWIKSLEEKMIQTTSEHHIWKVLCFFGGPHPVILKVYSRTRDCIVCYTLNLGQLHARQAPSSMSYQSHQPTLNPVCS